MHTSITRVVETLLNSTITDEISHDQAIADATTKQIVELLTTAPHYVIDTKLVALGMEERTSKGITAMVHAGVRMLPFDPILLEFRLETGPEGRSGPSTTCFVRLQTKPAYKLLGFRPFGSDADSFEADLYAYTICVRPHPEMPGSLMIALNQPDNAMIVQYTKPPEPVPFKVWTGLKVEESYVEEDLALATIIGTKLALFLLNTKGVEKIQVDTGRLNKARAKSGHRIRVNPYTVVRIGHIYDASGKAHAIGTTGRHMPVHWRQGYVRNQRYGPYSEPAKHRPVEIPPCLVNYQGDGVPPLPKREVQL